MGDWECPICSRKGQAVQHRSRAGGQAIGKENCIRHVHPALKNGAIGYMRFELVHKIGNFLLASVVRLPFRKDYSFRLAYNINEDIYRHSGCFWEKLLLDWCQDSSFRESSRYALVSNRFACGFGGLSCGPSRYRPGIIFKMYLGLWPSIKVNDLMRQE